MPLAGMSWVFTAMLMHACKPNRVVSPVIASRENVSSVRRASWRPRSTM